MCTFLQCAKNKFMYQREQVRLGLDKQSPEERRREAWATRLCHPQTPICSFFYA